MAAAADPALRLNTRTASLLSLEENLYLRIIQNDENAAEKMASDCAATVRYCGFKRASYCSSGTQYTDLPVEIEFP